MFIPLHDANSLKHIKVQYVTISLIVINVVVWLFTGPLLAPRSSPTRPSLGLGYIPAIAFDYAQLAPDLVLVPDEATYITYAFLHGDFWHLAGNMLFLWVFGDNVEDALGHFRFLIFYLLCAAAGALATACSTPHSEAPLIGASGAISGVVAAYFLLHPKVRVWVLVLFRIPLAPARLHSAGASGSASSSSCWWSIRRAAFPGARMSAASLPGSFWLSFCDAGTCRCSTARSSRRAPSGMSRQQPSPHPPLPPKTRGSRRLGADHPEQFGSQRQPTEGYRSKTAC